jgi:hypothetical protein
MTKQESERGAVMLDRSQRELQQLARDADGQITLLTAAFQDLARRTDVVLSLATEIMESLESEGVRSVLEKVQFLGTTIKSFFEQRLQATSVVLDAVESEAKLLRQFSLVTRRQESVALKTSVLTMYTNIEVGRLGSDGSGFQHLSERLSQFSKALAADTYDLSCHIESRRREINASRQKLTTELPLLQAEFVRIEENLGEDMETLQKGLTDLSEVPTRFRACFEDLSNQISQVVSAIQSHDISRQQLEHVEAGLLFVSSKIRDRRTSGRDALRSIQEAYSGLKIQIYQLQNVKTVVSNWISQIGSCVDIIVSVSASDIAAIGPFVHSQEQQVEAKLLHIEQLEEEGEEYSTAIRNTLGGRSTLLQLVQEHATKSMHVRHDLHLLSLNSIIESTRLGNKADAVSEIAKSISGISTDWGVITEQSDKTVEGIVSLVNETSTVIEVFSASGKERLAAATLSTRGGLDDLKRAASVASSKAEEMQVVTGELQRMSMDVDRNGKLLEATYGRIDRILDAISDFSAQLERSDPKVEDVSDLASMENLFSSSYTTQIEREIAHAALHGAALPVAQVAETGNDVELF